MSESLTPGYALEIEAAIAEAGQIITLRRLGSPVIDVRLPARVLTYDAQQIGSGVVQGERQVIIGNVSITEYGWPGPPQRGDQIIFDNGRTSTVQGCDSVQVGSEVVRHNLRILGS